MFDELFPSTARKFDVQPLDGVEWAQSILDDALPFIWSQWVLSCELLSRAASFRGQGDLFLTPRFYSRVSYLRGEFAMARGEKKRDPIPDSSKAEWKGFLDYRLSDDDLVELDGWKPKPQELWSEIDEMIKAGYRFTLSYNAKTHLASCTMIDDSNMRPSGGYAISSADSDGALALKMAVFKHLKLERTWLGLLEKPQPMGRRG